MQIVVIQLFDRKICKAKACQKQSGAYRFVVYFEVSSVCWTPEWQCLLFLQGEQQKAKRLIHNGSCQTSMYYRWEATDTPVGKTGHTQLNCILQSK